MPPDQTPARIRVGVQRALALGLDASHPILRKASSHLTKILTGKTRPRDRSEKNDRWPTGVQLFAASTLARIRPDHAILELEVFEQDRMPLPDRNKFIQQVDRLERQLHDQAATRAERDSARRRAVEGVLLAYGLMKITEDVSRNFEVAGRTK